MTIIYDIDLDKPTKPEDVRDAMVQCFTKAHSVALANSDNYNKDLSKTSFDQIKKINIKQMIKNYFNDVGGDYNHPTRDSIIKVAEKLKEFANYFENADIIEVHFNEIKTLVEKLKE